MYSILTPLIYSFRIEFTIIFAVTIVTGMSYYQDCSSISNKNNNKTRGCSLNRPTASCTPLVEDLDEVGRNRSQSDTPHVMSHFERSPSGNNLTSAANLSGMNLSNRWPIPDNPTSTNQTKTDNDMWQSNIYRTR